MLGFLFTDLPPYGAQANIDAIDAQCLALSTAEAIPEADHASSDAWQLIPCTNIVCTRDKLVPSGNQSSVATKYAMGLVELASDHCPMVSHPAALVEVVKEIAGAC